jgi:hypothetical protein
LNVDHAQLRKIINTGTKTRMHQLVIRHWVGDGVTSYIKVHVDVLLEWADYFSLQIYDNVSYQARSCPYACQTLNVDHAQLRKIINTGTKTRHRKSNLRNKGQYHLSSEKHVMMIINYYLVDFVL